MRHEYSCVIKRPLMPHKGRRRPCQPPLSSLKAAHHCTSRCPVQRVADVNHAHRSGRMELKVAAQPSGAVSDLTKAYANRLLASLSQQSRNPTNDRLRATQFVFPHPDDSPAQPFKFVVYASVASNVGFEFGQPEVRVRCRHVDTPRTTMPKTTVNKNSNLLCGKCEVGTTRNREMPAPATYAVLAKQRCET